MQCLCSVNIHTPYLVIYDHIKLKWDIEKNPGPNLILIKVFLFATNLNSIPAQNFLKLSISRAHITVHNFDPIGLSETYRFIHFT